MKMSENINELAKALSLAQGEMEGASKNAQNPHLKNRYADISAVWEVVRTVLPKHGLAVSQVMCDDTTEGNVCVESILMHTSGQWIASRCTLPAPKRDPQGYGSAITYARRYSLSAIVGVVSEEDDDGEAATRGRSQQRQQSHPRQEAPPQRQSTQPQTAQPQQQPAPPELHDLEAVEFDIVTCNTEKEISDYFLSLRTFNGHPQRDTIAAMCAKRKAELVQSAPAAGAAAHTVEKLSPAQNKAIQTYYSTCRMDRPAKLKHLSEFFNRPITTTNDLTRDEASRLIEAFKQQEQAA